MNELHAVPSVNSSRLPAESLLTMGVSEPTATLRNIKKQKLYMLYGDPGKMIDFVVSLDDEQTRALQIKTNEYFREECKAHKVFQIIVNFKRKEMYIDVVGSDELLRKRKLLVSQKLADDLKASKDVMKPLAYYDEKFQELIFSFIMRVPNAPIRAADVFLYPMVDHPFSIVVVVADPGVTSEICTSHIVELFMLIWPVTKKSLLYENELAMKQVCQHLLRVTKKLLSQVACLDSVLQYATDQAKTLLKAYYCSIKLIDPERMQLVDRSGLYISRTGCDGMPRKFPLDKGITGKVIATGEMINSKNLADDSDFDPIVDGIAKVECKNFLCFPIRDQSGIIGVAMVMNKMMEPFFDRMDEEIALAFSVYCGVCILNSMVYHKIQEAHVRKAVMNEMILYHMKIAMVFNNHPEFCSVYFNPRALPLPEFPCYALKMFRGTCLHKKFAIKEETIIRFILQTKKGYRDVAYHNWYHSFSVAQWAYAAIRNFRLIQEEFLSDLQALMYLVSAFVHDLDHRGSPTSFDRHRQISLTALYSSDTSVMERHHLAQAMCILNTEGCNLLAALTRTDYERALVMLRDNILATDLSNFYKNLREYQSLNMSGQFMVQNPPHAVIFQGILMNAADFGDQLQDWECHKTIAAAVVTEFFNPSEAEKSSGEFANPFIDRDNCYIPELEINFLSEICLPLYQTLGEIVPRADSLVSIILEHLRMWEGAKEVFDKQPPLAGLKMLLDPNLDKMIEANILEQKLKQEQMDAVVEEEVKSD